MRNFLVNQHHVHFVDGNWKELFIKNFQMTPTEKDEKRLFWARTETDHLRETRSLKIVGTKALRGNASPIANFEVVKILGKGSFGVVRLVREKGLKRSANMTTVCQLLIKMLAHLTSLEEEMYLR